MTPFIFHRVLLAVFMISILMMSVVILRLYKKYRAIIRSYSNNEPELNVPSLFGSTYRGYMLRFPIPVYSDIKNDKLQQIIARHNKLTYLYYVLCGLALFYFSAFAKLCA